MLNADQIYVGRAWHRTVDRVLAKITAQPQPLALAA